MSDNTVVRRYKGFEVTAHKDGTATFKKEGQPEFRLDTFTWTQFKISVKEDKFEFPNR